MGMGRPSKPESVKARNAGFTAYPQEIAAIKKVSRARRFKAPFDYVRHLVREDDDPFSRGKISEARRLKIPLMNRDPFPAPNSPLPPQA